MNSPAASHCSGCGLGLGLCPIGEETPLACPDCGILLQGFAGGPGELRDCGRCGGQFVDHALLRDLIERREIYGEAAPRPFAKENPLRVAVRYRKCPVCGELMNRRNFGHASGIIVDQCGRHGTWFDIGELPRVLEFVETGGFARARKAELDDKDKHRQEAQAAFSAQHGDLSVFEGNAHPSLVDAATDAVSSLLDAVARFMTNR